MSGDSRLKVQATEDNIAEGNTKTSSVYAVRIKFDSTAILSVVLIYIIIK